MGLPKSASVVAAPFAQLKVSRFLIGSLACLRSIDAARVAVGFRHPTPIGLGCVQAPDPLQTPSEQGLLEHAVPATTATWQVASQQNRSSQTSPDSTMPFPQHGCPGWQPFRPLTAVGPTYVKPAQVRVAVPV